MQRLISPRLSAARRVRVWLALAAWLTGVLGVPRAALAASRASLNPDQVLVLNGQKVFPIGFTLGPPPDGVTPAGKPAFHELAEAGALFMRTGTTGGAWT